MNDAVNVVVKDLAELTGGADMKISMDIMELILEITGAEEDLHNAVNELCYQCGKYREDYLGACNGCRWKTLKGEF